MTHSATAATNRAAFPDDEPLDARGTAWAADAGGRLGRSARTACSPAAACRETAAALYLAGPNGPRRPDRDLLDPELRDWDLGRWRGRGIDEVAAAEPAAVTAWLTEPDAAPHGGETLAALLARVAGWLDAVPADGHTVAVTHPAVVRAAIVATLGAGSGGFWRVDVAPLTATVLRGRPGRWTLRSTGLALRPARDESGAPAES